MNDAILHSVSEAVQNGISPEGVQRLRKVLQTSRKALCIRLPRPPAEMEPMRLVLKPNATPFFAKGRRFTPDQRTFISTYVDKLVEFGIVKVSTNATWAAPPVLVPEPPPAN